MSLTVSQGEGMTVITITSNPKSKWPVLCQILSSQFCIQDKLTKRAFWIAVSNFVLGCFGFVLFYLFLTWVGVSEQNIQVIVLIVLHLCVAVGICVLAVESLRKKGGSAELVDKTSESREGIWQYLFPFSYSCNMTLTVSQEMKEKLTDKHTALGTVQIIVGVMNIAAGGFGFVSSFWIGGVFLVVGIMCVLAVQFPRLLVFLEILNIVSAALAVTAVVLYSMDLAMGNNLNCYNGYSYYSSSNDFAKGNQEKINPETCLYYRDLSLMIIRGLEIMMIVLSVLQLCVSISFCVVTGKVLRKKDEDAKDPEIHKPLLEDDTASAA